MREILETDPRRYVRGSTGLSQRIGEGEVPGTQQEQVIRCFGLAEESAVDDSTN